MSSPSRLEAFLAEPRNMIVAGIRKDGRPHLTPNWFYWDGTKFYVSTTRNRAKYAVFRRDPRAELLVDDSIGYRYVRISGMVEIREDIPAELPRFRAIREKHGRRVPPDADLAAQLIAESRVLLAVTPSGSPSTWTAVGLD
jgi:PPOX class probable F420-dependent enzyme